jgi:ribonuclease HI
LGNPGRGASAAVIEYPTAAADYGIRRVCLSQKQGLSTTNNICELRAIEMACVHVIGWCPPLSVLSSSPMSAHILTDSLYCVNLLKWPYRSQPSANVELVERVRSKMRGSSNKVVFDIHWVGGHAGIEGNELADQLAEKSAKEL